MKSFRVPIRQGYSTIYYQVELYNYNNQFEEWKITRDNQEAILRSNRPMLIGKGLKYKPPTWKLLSSNIPYANILEEIKKAIMNIK